MKNTFATLCCLLVVTFASGQTVEDDIKAIREELRPTNRSGPYIAKHADKRIKAWQTAAEKGDAGAQWLLGRCHEQGVGGLKEDSKEAAKWHRKSADQGFGLAENSLGLLYEDGEGVEKSVEEAVKWLMKAADRGEFLAYYNLGRMHRKGIIGDKNIETAIKWYKKAADAGHWASITELGQMYEHGRSVNVDEKEALKWYSAGSEAGDSMATARALVVYRDSLVVKKDDAEIKRLQEKLKQQVGDDANEIVLRAGIQRNPIDKQAPNAKSVHNGKEVKLSDYRGKVVILKFTAPWCKICKDMVPQQEKMLKRLKDEPFAILEIDIDKNEDMAEQWDVTALPVVYFIDHKGIIRQTTLAPEKWDDVVDKLLATAKEKK